MHLKDGTRAAVGVAILVLGAVQPTGRAAADPFLDLPNGARVYSTGIDVSAGVDQRWAMTLNPFAPGSATANLNSAPYLAPNDASSAWIGPAQADVHTPESVYRVRTLVDLTGVALSGLSIRGYWVSDNRGLDILVNGNPTGFTNPGGHTSQPSATPANQFVLDAGTGLVAGVNVVEFEWGNGPAGGAGSQVPDPTHVRVEFAELTQGVPMLGLPSLILLGSALAAANLLARSKEETT